MSGDLPPKPVAVDGAKLRLYRMAKLATWLKVVRQVTPQKAQAFMILNFGLRKRTSQAIIDDMITASLLMLKGKTLELTNFGEKWLQELRRQGEF